jgi:hypothetical protein
VLRIDGSPDVKESKGHEVEGEIVAPICTRLIPISADRNARKMAQKQRSGAAMRDDRHVTVDRLGRQDGLRRSSDPSLCIDSALPPAHAFLWSAEELIGNSFKFWLRQVASRGTVVFSEFRYRGVRNSQSFRDDMRSFRRRTISDQLSLLFRVLVYS